MTDEESAEREAIAVLGLLTHAYVDWDPPIPAGQFNDGRPNFTHFAGLNIHAIVIDNVDGEVLSLERNQIHENEDPTRHAEPAAMRSALARLRDKRPRSAGMSVEEYYQTKLFYDPGTAPADYVDKGCTLYTTLEPCPMCTSMLCVARMKRTAFVIKDPKFGDSFPFIYDRFYKMFHLKYDHRMIRGSSAAAQAVSPIIDTLDRAVADMHAKGTYEIWYLDSLHALLGAALDALTTLRAEDVHTANALTLKDLKRLCKLPG